MRRHRAAANMFHMAALVTLCGAALVAGCAPGQTGGPGTRPTPAIAPPMAAKSPAPAGYDGRRDSLDSVDPSVLRGHRIMLDPGHGGFFPGTRGVNGLTEKEVNLGVALALRDLLRAGGASVQMSRETDIDFLTPADSSLRSDLAERARRNNAFAPALFVSIHHNADPGGAHDVNESQIYHQLGDEGPAYEFAQDVHRSFARNLGIEPTKLLPGNFYVLRTSDAPSLLSEASYLTYPPTEARLRTPAGQRLEAEVLYMGIVRWFMRRTPRIESLEALSAAGMSDTLFAGAPRLAARITGAYDAATLRIDGAVVPVLVSGERVEWAGTPALAAGAHEATLSARLATEGSAPVKRVRFRVTKPPASLTLLLHGSPLATTRATFAAEVRVFDRDRLPLGDTVRVRLTSEPPGVFAPAETTIIATDGVALGYLRRTHTVSVRLAARATLVARALHAPAVPAARLPLATQTAATRAAFVRVVPGDTALALPAALLPVWLDRNGFATLAARAGEPFVLPRLAGYRVTGADTAWPGRVTAIAGGALHGRRVMIDPEGGGDDAAGTARGGTRASALNLDVARALAAMLTAAGAEVGMTRDAEQAVSELERVQRAEGFRAERYLRIGHANTTPKAGHYFSSGGGRRWGQRVAATLAALGLPGVVVGESAKYPIAQVSAVALDVSLARTDSSDAALRAPGRLRAEAYALFVALAAELASGPPEWPVDSVAVLDTAGVAVGGAPVRLGGALVLQTDAAGIARFMRTEPGAIEVVVEDARAALRAVLLDSERGRVLRAPR